MQIIDAHQHFWDLDANYLPWLSDKIIPFRYGDYAGIRNNYLVDDYLRDSSAFDVVGTVFVETEWDPSDPLGEVAWVDEQQKRFGLPSVMVAQAWLDRDDVEDVLSAEDQFSFVRGIRHKPAAAADPRNMALGASGSMGDPAWRRGYGMLARHNFSFDLQTPWWHLREAVDLAEAHPETPIILNHTGLPVDRSQDGLAGWQEALRLLAEVPNSAIKISGLGATDRDWTADSNRRVVLEAIDIFGIERCMFASNFPVDSLVATYQTIFEGFFEITEILTEAERKALFYDNAVRVYRMDMVGGDNYETN